MTGHLSIVTAFDERERLEEQAKAVWDDAAYRLSKLIPEDLRSFASESGWLKNDLWWVLPDWLQCLVNNTRVGACIRDRYRQNDLESHGFESFDDLKAKFRELEKAWEGLIRIVVDDREGRCVEISYYAIEILNTSDQMKSPDREVWNHGTVMFITNTIDSPEMEWWVQKVAKISGQRVDWYCAGGHIVRALGDLDKVRGAIMLLISEHDELWGNAVKAFDPGLDGLVAPRPAWWPER